MFTNQAINQLADSHKVTNNPVSYFLGRPKESVLGQILWSFRKEFLWVGFFSLVANVLMLSPTIYMMQIYDRVLISKSELTLLVLTGIIALFFMVMAFAEWIRARLLIRTGVRLDVQLSSKLFNNNFEAYLKNSKTNPAEAFSDLNYIRQFVTGAGILAFFDAPWTPIYIAVSFLLHPVLGYLAILFCLIQFGLAVLNHKLTANSLAQTMKANSASNNYLFSKLRNAEPAQAMGMVGNLRLRWLDYHHDYLVNNASSHDKQLRIQNFNKFVRYTMQSISLGVAALLVIQGDLSVGSMIAANVLVARALQPLDLLVNTWKQFIQALESYKRLDGLLGNEQGGKVEYVNLAAQGEFSLKNIELRELTANVDGREKPILNGLNASFIAGQVVAVVGPSGSGKSTLARCLLGIWPGVNEQVLLDGVAIEHWDRQLLGPHLGYLPQDIELFDGTIAENIARFSELDSKLVVEAAKSTGMHESILRFPKGYETLIGEAGNILSGGQRQRLGLARAIYANPSLIVLDEPNANLDEVGEKSLIQTIKHLKAQGKTVFVITHRLSLLESADQLLVMKDGEIVHSGARDEVLKAMRMKPAQVGAS